MTQCNNDDDDDDDDDDEVETRTRQTEQKEAQKRPGEEDAFLLRGCSSSSLLLACLWSHRTGCLIVNGFFCMICHGSAAARRYDTPQALVHFLLDTKLCYYTEM